MRPLLGAGLVGAPDARRQARLACRAAAPSSHDVVRFDEEQLAVLLAAAVGSIAIET